MRRFDLPQKADFVLLWDVIFGVCNSTEEDRMVVSNIAKTLKSGGRCLFEVYNKEFAVSRGIEDAYEYDQACDRFLLRKEMPGYSIPSIKLYSHAEWEQMLTGHGMKIAGIGEGWKWKDDPAPPPWRADYIVAEKKQEREQA